ncbi:oxidoreductase-like protein [Dothidotthia symphoricarpi CBS 119687]|uniref:Oxidoreductase-like protein n=1 Tax=Dothidotthia symphoricarpi CBS 119687 TaxID=1392245 RepID=A0A6A6AJL0_9PLEO|nr:oxidoreductase-like protein [Dothidotthia symphoricarpi CBS 119687]KAF2131990.1 oxidoreductase-like protein [Dothidotthia symphoricarpi CBS 119687]
MTAKPAIGFCGLGAMGIGMATHLVKAGYAVTGFDLYAPSLERFATAGGIPSTSLSESAKDKPFYIVMVAAAYQAQPALFAAEGIVQALPHGATLLLCSTVPSAYAKSVEKALVDAGRDDIYFVDAPVSGGAGRAADGTLSIMAGASEAALHKGKWLLDELSAPTKLFIVQGGIGAGSNMKMVHQVLAAVQILAVSEAYGFAARLGLNGQDVYEAVVGGEAWSWMFENRSQRTLKEDYFPGASALTIILKDTGIITSTARSVDFPVTLCSVAEQVYFSALDRGWGANDDAGVVRLWTSEPVSSIQSTLSADEKKSKLQLVSDLLIGIHICAAVEAILLAQRVGIPLSQFYELACDAAGGSVMFKSFGGKLIPLLNGATQDSVSVSSELVRKLRGAVEEAQTIKCPIHLGSAALNLMLQAGKTADQMAWLRVYGML